MIKQSREHQDPLMVTVAGQVNAGKTVLAATFSEFFPLVEPGALAARAKDEACPWISLDDLLFMKLDRGALDGLKAWKISVPFVDWDDYYPKNPFPRARALMMADVQKYMAANPKAALVGDTVTALNTALVAYAEDAYDGPKAWGAVTEEHHQFHQTLLGLRCTTILNFHFDALTEPIKVGAAGDQAAKDQKLRDEAAKSAGGGNLVLSVHKASRKMYQGHASLKLAIVAKRVGDKLERSVLTQTQPGGVEAGVRRESLLAPVEQPNLRAIAKKSGYL